MLPIRQKSTKPANPPTCKTCLFGMNTMSGVDCHAPISVGQFRIEKSDNGYEFLPLTFCCNQHPEWSWK